MHFAILLTALLLAWLLRLQSFNRNDSLQQRWQRSLSRFLFSPLLLISTAIALVCMGPNGQMVWGWEGWFSYSAAIAFLAIATVLAIKLSFEGLFSLQRIRAYPQFELAEKPARLLSTSIPFIARVGFWSSELVVSKGLLDTFDADHLEAVLTHEQAHHYYRDTFWFFWLGWLRKLTAWLPQTETLWQELLLLREHRADSWAAQQVDTLLLAESLLLMVSAPELYSETICAAFSCVTPQTRFEERIEALLSNSAVAHQGSFWPRMWLLLVLLPLITIPFHY